MGKDHKWTNDPHVHTMRHLSRPGAPNQLCNSAVNTKHTLCKLTLATKVFKETMAFFSPSSTGQVACQPPVSPRMIERSFQKDTRGSSLLATLFPACWTDWRNLRPPVLFSNEGK
ncbi:hypothetical protein BaRGS_00014862 [Batillaria attramentaria]|uniref:Uncharacterized protein n=1 Tax=Batillaria attramentaria TaxID=370345 RepID=A0ABD0L3S3_9CAEN